MYNFFFVFIIFFLFNIKVRELLISGKVDPNAADVFKRTALHLASSRGYSHICEILIHHGANPNLKDSVGNTPLHLAACAWNIPVITALVNGGASSIIDNNNRTPWDMALGKYELRKRDGKVFENLEIITRIYFLLYPKSTAKVQNEDDLKNLLDNLTINE